MPHARLFVGLGALASLLAAHVFHASVLSRSKPATITLSAAAIASVADAAIPVDSPWALAALAGSIVAAAGRRSVARRRANRAR